MWGLRWLQVVGLVLILGCREHKLDCDIHHEVSQLIIVHNSKNPINSWARAQHTAWMPPSLPDSIILLGGDTRKTELTAEILPGFNFKAEEKLFLFAQEAEPLH